MAMAEYKQPPLDEEHLLARKDSDETLRSEQWTKAQVAEDEPTGPKTRCWARCVRKNWVWLGHVILLSISAILFTSSVCLRRARSLPDLACSKQLSSWSPAENVVAYETVRFDLPVIPAGPFVGKGDDVDAAWSAITDLPDIMISAEEMARLGMPTENALFITDPDTGKQGYRAAVEVFHQLHCLNLLRQNRFFGHYSRLGGDASAGEEDLIGHLDHCIDALRQMIMCQSDVGVFPFYYEFKDDPWPNYATPHTCRNYNAVRQWAVENGVRRGPDEPEH